MQEADFTKCLRNLPPMPSPHVVFQGLAKKIIFIFIFVKFFFRKRVPRNFQPMLWRQPFVTEMYGKHRRFLGDSKLHFALLGKRKGGYVSAWVYYDTFLI
mmetsp:Transcript_38220/g.85330  ORF Transcript_38220/g.85330 Transcript_38220/m.85330 type:complete len:100 (+) Transcript_38220:283-582(+)